jgi:ABC-type multidrug transport system ATPase subunit
MLEQEGVLMKITINNLVKEYKVTGRAINSIDLTIEGGAFGLLGDNGAGKTTLMRILTSLISPTSGKVDIAGVELCRENYDTIKRMIGYSPQDAGIYPNLTVEETLDYFGGMCGLNKSNRIAKTNQLLFDMNLEEHRKKKNKSLSGGMKKRLVIAQALVNDPDILIVDEPTAGVDPEERINIRNALSRISREKLVLISTHVLEDVEAICNKLCVIKKGNVKYIGTVEEMKKMVGNRVFRVTTDDDNEINRIEERYIVTRKNYGATNTTIRFIGEANNEKIGERCEATIEDAYIFINEQTDTNEELHNNSYIKE